MTNSCNIFYQILLCLFLPIMIRRKDFNSLKKLQNLRILTQHTSYPLPSIMSAELIMKGLESNSLIRKQRDGFLKRH